jgi:hypothetical protein
MQRSLRYIATSLQVPLFGFLLVAFSTVCLADGTKAPAIQWMKEIDTSAPAQAIASAADASGNPL